MRGILLTFSTVCAIVVLAAPADAQFNFSAQGAVISGVDDLGTIVSGAPNLKDTYGLGARVGFKVPLFPIGVLGQGVVPERHRWALLEALDPSVPGKQGHQSA